MFDSPHGGTKYHLRYMIFFQIAYSNLCYAKVWFTTYSIVKIIILQIVLEHTRECIHSYVLGCVASLFTQFQNGKYSLCEKVSLVI